ncbi:uncharacterized protein [Panulirus ornatus]|uniref:uncharacterized protein isoform X1 n=1 Tax=Panulirus ornatus TaxID=150431 RepID=UPI003A8BC2C2
MQPKQHKTYSDSSYAPTPISFSQVDVTQNGGIVHSPVMAATPSNFDNISDYVPQQQNIMVPWREIHAGEFIFTGDYLSDNSENGYEDCNPVTKGENRFKTVNIQNDTRMHSRFKFQDHKGKVKKKMMTRMIHTISCEKENVNITGQQLTPQDHYLDITGQELTPRDHFMTVDHCQDYPCTSRHGVSDAVDQCQDYPSTLSHGVSNGVDQCQDYPSTLSHGVSNGVDQCQDYPSTSSYGVSNAVDQCQDYPSTLSYGVSNAVDQCQNYPSTLSHGVSNGVDQCQDYPSTLSHGVSNGVDQCQDYPSTSSYGVSNAVDQCQDYPSTSSHGVSNAVDQCQDYSSTLSHGVSNAVDQCQDYPSTLSHGVSNGVDQCQDYPSTLSHGVSNAVDQCQDYPSTLSHGVSNGVDQCQDYPSTLSHGVSNGVDQCQDYPSTLSHGVSNGVDQCQDYPSTLSHGVGNAVDQCQDYPSTSSHGVDDAVDQCQDYPSTSSHGVSNAVDLCQDYACTSRLGVCDAQKVKVLNESTFGCPFFNISLSPIIDSSPVCESLSHSVPEKYTDIDVAPDVITSKIFEKDENYILNIKEKETCAEYIIDSYTYKSALAPQESIVNYQLHAQKELDIVTDDAQKESDCVLHNKGKKECAYFMQSVGKGERLDPKPSVDVGCSLVDNFVSRGFPNKGNELCNIPVTAVSENSGKVESRDSKVCSTCSVELCRCNADIDLKHEFAFHVSSSHESQLSRGKILNEMVPMEFRTTNKSENMATRYAKEHGKRDRNYQQNIPLPYSGKPVFKIPFRKIPESPICSYPLNRKHITSTPKDICQGNNKKKDFDKQGERYSSGCKSANVTTNGKEEEEVYTSPHSCRQGCHLSVKHASFKPETTVNECNETTLIKKKQILKQRLIQKSSHFKIPSLTSEINQKDRSQQLQIANNAAELSCEEEQQHVELEPKCTTHLTFISQACWKDNSHEKISYGSCDNSVLKGRDDFTSENVQNRTSIDINPFKIKGVSTGNIGLKEKLKKLSLLPMRFGDNAPDEIQSKSLIFSLMSKEVAEKDEETLEAAEKDSHYFDKISQIKESNDNNINSFQKLHTDLKRSNAGMPVKECCKRNESKKRKATDNADLKKNRNKRFCEEKALLGKTDSRINKTQKGSEQKKEPKPKDRKMKLKKQKDKSCEGKNSTSVRGKTANSCGTEGKKTEKLRERKTLCLIDKVVASSDVTKVSFPQHVLGCDANLFAIREYITAATEICFTLLYRDGSTQLRERVSGSMQHPGVGQVTGFAFRIMWRPDAAPPAQLLPQHYLENGIAPHTKLACTGGPCQ